ncbi:hypothetical protein HK102_012760, partial [Quaeritorhiza haematococci]
YASGIGFAQVQHGQNNGNGGGGGGESGGDVVGLGLYSSSSTRWQQREGGDQVDVHGMVGRIGSDTGDSGIDLHQLQTQEQQLLETEYANNENTNPERDDCTHTNADDVDGTTTANATDQADENGTTTTTQGTVRRRKSVQERLAAQQQQQQTMSFEVDAEDMYEVASSSVVVEPSTYDDGESSTSRGPVTINDEMDHLVGAVDATGVTTSSGVPASLWDVLGVEEPDQVTVTLVDSSSRNNNNTSANAHAPTTTTNNADTDGWPWSSPKATDRHDYDDDEDYDDDYYDDDSEYADEYYEDEYDDEYDTTNTTNNRKTNTNTKL